MRLLALLLALLLTGCSPYSQASARASEGARIGAPYYRGQPGGVPVEVRVRR